MLNRGFTLIEVLVTLVILTFGLLGIAGLMAKGQRASFEAFQRQQAISIASDMAERIRANRKQVATYIAAAPIGTPVGQGTQYNGLLDTAVTDCGTYTCTPAQIAAYDVALWDGLLLGYSEAQVAGGARVGGIVNARGCVTQTAETSGTCPAAPSPSVPYTVTARVSVAWEGNEDTVAPTSSTCGQGAYSAETKRRVVVLDLMVLPIMPLIPVRPFRVNPPAARMQRGLSLIEMMVGLTIGLVLTLGLFTLIANTSQSFKIQDDFSRMQENGATAFRYIGDSLRHAGFYGNTMATANIKVSSSSAVAMVNDCGAALPDGRSWAFDFTTPLTYFPDLTPASVSGVLPCIKKQNFYAGPPLGNPNPVLVTRGANGYRICTTLVAAPGPPVCTNPASLLSAQPDPKNTIYVQATPYDGQIFYGADYPTADTRKYSNGNDMEMFEYRTHVYYVRPCSRPAGGATDCTGAADDDNHPIPTLVRQELVGSSMTEVPLVEGVELIDYRFGIDTTGDGVADVFSAAPIATDWVNVVTVKVSMLVRSPGLNPAYDDSTEQYDLYGDGKTRIYKCTGSPAPACNYKRKVYSQTFQVRNVAQRKGA